MPLPKSRSQQCCTVNKGRNSAQYSTTAAKITASCSVAIAFITDLWGTYIEINQRPNQKYLQF